MKKSCSKHSAVFIFLLASVFFITSCNSQSQISDEPYNILQEPDEALEAVSGALKRTFSGEKEMTAFERIHNDYKDKKIEALDYSKSMFLAAFLPQKIKTSYGNTIYNNTKIDMRPYLQNLVYNHEDLEPSFQNNLRKILFPETIEPDKNQKTSSMKSLLIDAYLNPVYAADDDIYPMQEFQIIEGISIKTHDIIFVQENSDILTDAVLDSRDTFQALSFSHPTFKIEIIPGHLSQFTDSYSVYIPSDINEIYRENVFRIYLNSGLDTDTIIGCLIHELFHAYQVQDGLILPACSMDDETEWLAEASAVWAVDQVYSDNDYEFNFIDGLYESPVIEYFNLSEYKHHTWYQMFFYFTEVMNTFGNDYMKNLFGYYRLNSSLDYAFNEAHISRYSFNDDFAQLGKALFGGVKPSMTFQSADPVYPTKNLIIDAADFHVLDQFLEDKGSDWREETFTAPGFHYKYISIPPDFDGKITFIQNLEMEQDKQKTGMRIAVMRNGEWIWENTVFEEGMHTIDIGGSLDSIDSVMVMFFSTNFSEQAKLMYKITSSAPETAKGSIIYRWEKKFKPKEAGATEREIMQYVVVENLKKHDNAAQSGMDLTMNTILSGDMYYIEDMTIDYTYDYLYKKDDDKEQTLGAGSYSYKGTNAEHSGSTPTELPIPDLSGLEGIIGDMVPKVNELKDTVEGLGKNEDIKEFIPELPDLDIDLSELDNLTKDLPVAGSPGNGLVRICIRPELNVFELLPSLPPGASSEKWVDYETAITYKNKEGQLETSKKNYKDTTGELFPLWFVNPYFNYNEEISQPDMKDITNTMELSGTITGILDKSNRFNIKKLIDQPQTGMQIDMTKYLDVGLQSGTMIEKAMYNGKQFKAELTASSISKNGNEIRITITIQYELE